MCFCVYCAYVCSCVLFVTFRVEWCAWLFCACLMWLRVLFVLWCVMVSGVCVCAFACDVWRDGVRFVVCCCVCFGMLLLMCVMCV